MESRKGLIQIVLSVFVCMSVMAGDKYGVHQIEVRGKNPPRLKWEDVDKVYSQFADQVREQYSEMSKRTHWFFHGKFEDYFRHLRDEQKQYLETTYPDLWDDSALRDGFSFEEVFEIGNHPEALLFPLDPRYRKKIPLKSLEGLVLRGKKGEVKGTINTLKAEYVSYSGLQYNYEITTPEGDTIVTKGDVRIPVKATT